MSTIVPIGFLSFSLITFKKSKKIEWFHQNICHIVDKMDFIIMVSIFALMEQSYVHKDTLKA